MGNVKMRPIIILPPDVMSAEDIKKLTDNGMCVVTAPDPEAIKFVDVFPPMQRAKIEQAAIATMRKILNGYGFRAEGVLYQSDVASLFAKALIRGTSLDSNCVDPEEIPGLKTAKK